MTEYVEASPVARRVFVLCVLCVLLLLAGLAALDRYSNPSLASKGVNVPVEQMAAKVISSSWTNTFAASIAWVAIGLFNVWIAIKLLRGLRWPPDGWPMPFRTRIRRYKPWQAWGVLGASVLIPAASISGAWYAHSKIESTIQEILMPSSEECDENAQPAIQADAAAPRRLT